MSKITLPDGAEVEAHTVTLNESGPTLAELAELVHFLRGAERATRVHPGSIRTTASPHALMTVTWTRPDGAFECVTEAHPEPHLMFVGADGTCYDSNGATL